MTAPLVDFRVYPCCPLFFPGCGHADLGNSSKLYPLNDVPSPSRSSTLGDAFVLVFFDAGFFMWDSGAPPPSTSCCSRKRLSPVAWDRANIGLWVQYSQFNMCTNMVSNKTYIKGICFPLNQLQGGKKKQVSDTGKQLSASQLEVVSCLNPTPSQGFSKQQEEFQALEFFHWVHPCRHSLGSPHQKRSSS